MQIQGLSTGFDILWRPWRPSKNNFLVKMKVSVYFWGLGIWVSSTSFWKSNIGWPQQPPLERVPYISEKLNFWWSIPQKGTIIGHFAPKMIQPSGSVNFLMIWGCWGHWDCRGSKAWKITTGDFRVYCRLKKNGQEREKKLVFSRTFLRSISKIP